MIAWPSLAGCLEMLQFLCSIRFMLTVVVALSSATVFFYRASLYGLHTCSEEGQFPLLYILLLELWLLLKVYQAFLVVFSPGR